MEKYGSLATQCFEYTDVFEICDRMPYFFYQNLHFLFCCLFLCGYCLKAMFISLKKPAAINDGWILRCIRAMQWWSLDAVSSTLPWASQSCCQPWEWDLPTQRALALVIRNYLHMCACTAYTNCGCYPRAVFILLRASDYVAAIWGMTFIRRNMSIISSRDSYISHYIDRQDR